MGGKTGTSQENRDAWFVGVTPNLVAGAWAGGEDQSVHPRTAGEGSVIAMPIYAEFMRRVYADERLGISQADRFEVPPGAIYYDCREVGEMPTYRQSQTYDEFFD